VRQQAGCTFRRSLALTCRINHEHTPRISQTSERSACAPWPERPHLGFGRPPFAQSAGDSTVPKTTVLYVKEFNVPGKVGFWGLTRNQIDRLEKAAPRWYAILLLRNVAAGYVLTSAQVLHRIADGSFELSRDGDFKVNEALDLKPAQAFRSLDVLLDQIL